MSEPILKTWFMRKSCSKCPYFISIKSEEKVVFETCLGELDSIRDWGIFQQLLLTGRVPDNCPNIPKRVS